MNKKIVIYETITKVYGTKGKNSLYPGAKFVHTFKPGCRMIGLSNGDILLKSKNGKRLWNMYDQTNVK